MATDAFPLYPVIAQVAATFAGFGSLASGLGQRRGGDDSRMDAYRLQSMLLASLSATLLGLLPAVLGSLDADDMWGVQASAWVAMASIVIHTPPTMIRARKLRHVAGFSMRATVINSACVWGAFVAFGLCVLNIPTGRAAGLYLLGLMGLLASTVTLFSRVIVSMLRPYQNADEPH